LEKKNDWLDGSKNRIVIIFFFFTCAFGGQVMWFEERGKPEHLDDAADAVEISITDRK
jgi:hypothetical protein